MARNHDHVIAKVARTVGGAVLVALGVLALRSIPDLVRYIKIERM
jgi:hypothetical protein